MKRKPSYGSSVLLKDHIESRLIILAAIFLCLYAVILTLSPAGRARSWQVDYRWMHWSGYAMWLVFIFLAHRQISRRLPERDPYLLPAAALLSGWGLLTVWRLSPAFGLRQTIWIGIGGALLILGSKLPSQLDFLRKYKYLFLTGGLLLTGMTLAFGTNPLGYGPRIWLGCCGVYLQPSEPLKLLLVIYLAAFLADRLPFYEQRASEPGHPPALLPLLAPTLLMIGLVLLLLLAQRDLGTAFLFLGLYTAIVYVASGRKRVLAAGALTLIAATLVGYVLFDVVRLRVDAWLNPWLDPSNRSYQIVQSLLAVASGGVFGRGPGLGNPGLVPVPHSDFIFASISEESGMIGGLGLLLAIALLSGRGLRVAVRASRPFHQYLAAGLITYLAGQSILIIGGNLRLLPLTGVTLPFVSYGGSSLLTAFLSLLLLEHISHVSEESGLGSPQSTSTYLHLSAALFVGLAAAALTLGWWAFYRGPALVTRTDNPRRAIADRFVPRGDILDRHNQPIAATIGQPGSYIRRVLYPPLSSIIGYTDQYFGQAGLEASLDDYLRGLRGYSELTIWWDHLLYGQPPPGLDVRLSLDLNLQRTLDQTLGPYTGAAVLLDARSGDILGMASHPTFDANQLANEWDSLAHDPKAPLLARAVQGFYPVGKLFSKIFPGSSLPLALASPVEIYLPIANGSDLERGVFSPLQAALAGAAVSNGGVRPAPVLAQAVNIPQTGWVLLPVLGEASPLLTPSEAERAANELVSADHTYWSSLSVVRNEPNPPVTWFIGGTLPGWKGTPLALSVLIEADAPEAARNIGETILKAAMNP